MDIKDKIRGVFYGQFIGDALGTRYEFETTNVIKAKINQDLVDNFLPILGGGPFKLVKGQVTDDTELAMALFCSLLEREKYDIRHIGHKYIKWIESNPFDIGNTTRAALNNAKTYDDIVQNSQKHNQSSLSNGCLMRISPLAVYGYVLPDEELYKDCMLNTIMTNPNPITIDCVKVYCAAIKMALQTSVRKTIFEHAYDTAKHPLIKQILIDSLTKPLPVLMPNGSHLETYSYNMGYCGIALQNTFYELINGINFYSSMVNTVIRGGDTDTNGCITGALLGAYYGKSQIPHKWINAVKINNPRAQVYPEVQQVNIDGRIEMFIELIENKQVESQQVESQQVENKQIKSQQIESQQIESQQVESQHNKKNNTMFQY